MSAPCLLVPLDDRPVTYRLPQQIGAIAGLEVKVPERSLLGNLERPADIPAIQAWLAENVADAQALVVAIETLGYGGLIPSRQSDDSLEVVQQRLACLVALKRAKPSLPIYGFSVTMRLSAQAAPEEEKPYWREHGVMIHRYSYHQDRYEQHGEAADLEAALEAKASVPDELLADYLDARLRNFAINRAMLEWTRRNLFDVLLLTQDDTSRYGFNVREQRQLSAEIEAAGLESRVLIYPGCDEVASVLVARHLNRTGRRTPAFCVRYATPFGGSIVPLYEDRPLERTVASQIAAVGGRVVTSQPEADVTLMVNTPSTAQGDWALKLNLDKVDKPARDLRPFSAPLHEPLGAVALADAAYANGADPELLRAFRDFHKLAAFAAWNTAGNTVGTVVAQASAFLDPGRDDAAHRQALLERMADDCLYQTMLRARYQDEAAVGESLERLEARLGKELLILWQRQFPRVPIDSIAATFPWGRLFEVDLTVNEHPPVAPTSAEDAEFEGPSADEAAAAGLQGQGAAGAEAGGEPDHGMMAPYSDA